MKVVVQNFRTGELDLVDVPPPLVRPGTLLVRTAASAVSAGTERLMMDFARKSLVSKALARPDLVRTVVNRVRTEGVVDAYRQAMSRLEKPTPLGYSSAGTVLEVGPGVEGYQRGDRVACTGQGYASHAEIVCVPVNLCAAVPDGVDWEHAAFAGLGAIALHGTRLSSAELGSRVMVIGLGVLGLIAVQLLRAAGCCTFGVDLDESRLQLAYRMGLDAGATLAQGDPLPAIEEFSGGHGVDAVLITAGAANSAPLELAASAARERARIVALGMIELSIPRREFYAKELKLIVPRSSGPGLYDPAYERRGVDYPFSRVRWTHGRNVAEFMRLASRGDVSVASLITHRIAMAQAMGAYALLDGRIRERHLGVLLTYPDTTREPVAITRRPGPGPVVRLTGVGVGVIGAGLFANATILPVLGRRRDVRLVRVATASGVTATHAARRYGFAEAAADPRTVLDDPDIQAVFILTRHDAHASLATEALERGKWVFVEKPLALDDAGLGRVARALEIAGPRLLVGFNRRYSPPLGEARRFLAASGGPIMLACRVNAGRLAPDSWVFDEREGGGRVRGEVCHFVDLAAALVGRPPARVSAEALPFGATGPQDISAVLRFADGSLATILYTAGGDKSYSRERIEAFGGGRVAVIDNFRRLELATGGRRRVRRWLNSQRGYVEEIEAFVRAVRGEAPLPTLPDEAVWVTAATFAIEEALTSREIIAVDQIVKRAHDAFETQNGEDR
jgi:predicted dehydrogenase/threonine dehydrogenase-like Zn-dependent dehydrogenase